MNQKIKVVLHFNGMERINSSFTSIVEIGQRFRYRDIFNERIMLLLVEFYLNGRVSFFYRSRCKCTILKIIEHFDKPDSEYFKSYHMLYTFSIRLKCII